MYTSVFTEIDTPHDDAPMKIQKLISDINTIETGGAIQGRVQSKSPLRVWKKQNSEGNIFSFVISDGSAEINIIATGITSERLHAEIQVGECYAITAYTPRQANLQYKTTEHDYELSLTEVSNNNA